MTSLTAIGGLAPLAIVIIGGLVSSTLLARLVTPVMYKLLPAIDGRETFPYASGSMAAAPSTGR